ncbi:hypothetical protein POVWA1_080810 [Plasmodium ovale wallikeri]|uniref:PIR Superfamily Protein n=1 Tax=Plasmodium ovale wallikeri TaxID=864142 RepID=A0A1A9AMB4_PLAOA|nr:hypothetical protein POVWA1_080810 [Plasmodium ovale wallikeri]
MSLRINEETEVKVGVLIKIEEKNNEFSNKCNSLKEYLDHYNKKYEKCFKSNIGYMYIEIRNSITQPLTKCYRHDESHTSRMYEEKKLTTPDSEQHKGHQEVDNPEKKTLELEKESKAAPACKDKLCETESSGNQYLPEIKEIHDGEPGKGKDKITSGSSREVATPNTLLHAKRQNTQDGAYSPTANRPEVCSLTDSVTNISLSQNYGEPSRPGPTSDTVEGETSDPSSQLTGVKPTTFLSAVEGVELSDLSSQVPKASPVDPSTSVLEVAPKDSPSHNEKFDPINPSTGGTGALSGRPLTSVKEKPYNEPLSSAEPQLSDGILLPLPQSFSGSEQASPIHFSHILQTTYVEEPSSGIKGHAPAEKSPSMEKLHTKIDKPNEDQGPGEVGLRQKDQSSYERKNSGQQLFHQHNSLPTGVLGDVKSEKYEQILHNLYSANNALDHRNTLNNKDLLQNSADSNGNDIGTYDTNPVTPETGSEGLSLRILHSWRDFLVKGRENDKKCRMS